MKDVIAVRHVRDTVLWLRFEDGTEGEVDLADELHGPIFEALNDPEMFAKVEVSSDVGTIVWPNGADFAPEFLYSRVQIVA